MVDLKILIEDSVGVRLGYSEPLKRLDEFVSPDTVDSVREWVLCGDDGSIPVSCRDGSGAEIRAHLSVRRAAAYRMVSVRLAATENAGRELQKGVLGEGTALWNLDVRSGEMRIEHRSGTAQEPAAFTIMYSTWLEMIQERDRQALDEQVQRTIATGTDLHTIARMNRVDGNERVIEAVGRAVMIDGVTTEVVGLTIDTTSRAAVSEAMVDQAARLELALAASGMGTWDWDIEPDVVTWSARVAEIFGTSLEEFATDFDEYEGFIHPEDLDLLRTTTKDYFEGGIGDFTVSHRIIRPTGEVRWVEAKGALLKGADGQPVRFLGTVWDTTAKRNQQAHIDRIERELARASDRFRLASESAGIGLWEVILETETFVWDAQMCNLLDIDQDSDQGSWDLMLGRVHPDDQKETVAQFVRSIEKGQGNHAFRVVLPDGSVRHLASFGRLIVDGKLGRVSVSLRETEGGLSAILRLASGAEDSARKAGFSDVTLFLKSTRPNLTLEQIADFAQNGPLVTIPNQGTISKIVICRPDGWITFGR